MARVPHVLVVDDDPKIREGLQQFLLQQSFEVTTASDGAQMKRKLAMASVDLIVLDVMLPGQDGFSLLRELRVQSSTPVILLTAVAAEADRIVGLEIGAEDYVCKPFSPRELLARVRAVLRRTGDAGAGRGGRPDSIYRFEGWVLDVRARTLTSPTGADVALTSGEFDLLRAFVEHPNRVLSRDRLLELSRGRSNGSVDRAIDVQVMRVRRKVEPDAQHPTLIKTLRNSGYLFTPVVHRGHGGA